MTTKCTAILSTIIVLAAIFIAYGYFAKKASLKHFKTYGVEATATVTKVNRTKERKYYYSGRKRFKSKYTIELTYFTRVEKPDSVPNKKLMERGSDGKVKMNFEKLKPQIGEFVSTSIKTTPSQLKRLNIKVGDRVGVVYLPNDIENCILKSDLD